MMKGRGRIINKTSGAELGIADYTIRVVPPSPGCVLQSIELTIDVPWRVGMEAQRDNEMLVLETADGKYLDFYVTTVTQDSIGVTATGAPRDAL